MKKIFKFLFQLAAFAVVFSSCTNYGKKIKVEGTKGEVYYKGDGVSEGDAKKLGEYLKKASYFDNTSKTVQLLKAKDGGYDVHFVVDEKKTKETADIEDNFVAFGVLISKDVFDGQPVNVYLADTHLKDFKTLPYDKKKADALLATDEEKTGNTTDTKKTGVKGYDDHKEIGDVDFFWKDISNEEAITISDYIVKNGAFSGGTAEIYMSKEGDRYVLKFPMLDQYVNQPTYQDKVEKISKEIKDNVFPNDPYTFLITDARMKTVKSFEY